MAAVLKPAISPSKENMPIKLINLDDFEGAVLLQFVFLSINR